MWVNPQYLALIAVIQYGSSSLTHCHKDKCSLHSTFVKVLSIVRGIIIMNDSSHELFCIDAFGRFIYLKFVAVSGEKMTCALKKKNPNKTSVCSGYDKKSIAT